VNRTLCSYSNISYFYIVLTCAVLCAGCAYSFTGASVPEHWKSIAIALFDDESSYGQPSLRENLTNMMIEKMQQDNTLRLADQSSASIELRCVITSVLPDQPISVAQGTQASRLQIRMTVRATLIDNSNNKEVWSKNLSASGDYPASSGLSGREAGLRQAMENLTDDLLLETVSAW
jgi:outer membrane lipopolysaccharide assembly protein LptE/RlpB